MPTNALTDVDCPVQPMPQARGPLSQWVINALGGQRSTMPRVAGFDAFGDDAQLALYLSYEPHFGPIAGLPDAQEWDVQRLTFRQLLEDEFERALRGATAPTSHNPSLAEHLYGLVAADRSPSLSRHMETHGTLSEMLDIVMHRSAYQLKEGDAHTFAIPRLDGRAKQLLVGIQAGEYGADAAGRRTHAQLFASTMESLGLRGVPNHYINELPGSAFAISNLVSMFGLNRRWRGALVGHLAIFEMTSVEPMRRYANGLGRLGVTPQAGRFYRVHTLADIEHETMAVELANEVVTAEPDLRDDVIFGAQCVLETERRFAATLFEKWSSAATRRGAREEHVDLAGATTDALNDAEIQALLIGEPWFTRF